MSRAGILAAVPVFLVLLPMLSGARGGQGAPPGPPQSPRLYLNVGTVEPGTAQGGPDLLRERTTAFPPGRAYVLQMNGAMTPHRRAALLEAGVELGDYIPRHAYLVDLSGVTPQALRQLPFVSWVGAYRNEWKLSPGIGKDLTAPAPQARGPSPRPEPLRLTVILFEGHDLADAKGDLAGAGAAVLGGFMMGGQGHVAVTVDPDQLPLLAELPQVQFIEQAPRLTLRNDTTQWIIQSNVTDLTPVYDNGIHGEGQIAGVIDGEPDQDHCSLDGGKILFYNAPDGDSRHGTHVSCTIVGNDTSIANLRGMAYAANMVFNKLPVYTETGIMDRLDLHHGQGARVHSNSWGDDSTTLYNSLSRGFDRFCWENEDDLVCLAVTNAANLRNPENAKNLLAVGASQDTPTQYNHCTGGIGPTADGRRKPEIYAPGCSTLSARYLTPCNVTSLTGTSMACPAVAGAGILARQYFMDGYYPTGAPDPGAQYTNPSGALLKAVLLNTAVDMTGISGYPSDLEGWGRVLLDDALHFPGESRKLVVLEDLRNAGGLSTAEQLEYRLTVLGSGERLKVTLVWTDPPASASTGTGFAAVNDLDLEVESPVGEVFKGNVFSGGVSVTGGTKDDRNNVEQVHLDAPDTGIWQVRVLGAAVNQDTQGFALVATGDAVETDMDFAAFHDCLNGPTLTPYPTPPRTVGDCLGSFDFDQDADVDLTDFGIWVEAFIGS
ncbi:MAG TPA: S8 family serine peptidase [Phycisphaerae bacterium]|nr:S8 family serine peptidase [Phycisphaerae bacterium]